MGTANKRRPSRLEHVSGASSMVDVGVGRSRNDELVHEIHRRGVEVGHRLGTVRRKRDRDEVFQAGLNSPFTQQEFPMASDSL